MDETTFASGLFSRFKKNRGNENWEDTIAQEVDRATSSRPSDVTIMIPAQQVELGRRLELTSRLMKEKGYRLRQVIPDSGMTWAASFMRLDE